MLGYPPILWYSDSYNYIADTVSRIPDVVRSSGYPLFLFVLLPFRSLTLVAALQALMGLGMGAVIYAVLRHRGLPWWGATLPALPVLFDVYEMQLEHMVMSDVLFIFLITVALAALCWRDRPRAAVCVVAGLMIGYAALVRSVGEPLLIIVVAGLLLRRVSWKRVALVLVAGILPIAGYAVWYHGFYGQYALDDSGGTFLYSRVSSFAECSKMHLPQRLTVLCDPRPPAQRPESQEYLWSTSTPLFKVSHGNQFAKQANSIAGGFARDAIVSQPLAYATVVLKDTAREFTWTRTQSNLTGFRAGLPVPVVRHPADQEQHAVVGAVLPAGQGRAAALRGPGHGPAGGREAVLQLHHRLREDLLPARHHAGRHPAAGRRGDHRPLAALGRPGPDAVGRRRGAGRAAADDGRLQLPVRDRGRAGRVPRRRAGPDPRAAHVTEGGRRSGPAQGRTEPGAGKPGADKPGADKHEADKHEADKPVAQAPAGSDAARDPGGEPAQ